MNRDNDREEIRHRARLLKAQGKLARVPTSAIFKAGCMVETGAIYADYVKAGTKRMLTPKMLPNQERDADPATIAYDLTFVCDRCGKRWGDFWQMFLPDGISACPDCLTEED